MRSILLLPLVARCLYIYIYIYREREMYVYGACLFLCLLL